MTRSHASSSGAGPVIWPSGPTMKPSSEIPIEYLTSRMGSSLAATSLGVAGVVGSDVDGRQGATRARHELLDLELGLGEELGAALVEGDPALVEGNRALERQAAGFELGDGPL